MEASNVISVSPSLNSYSASNDTLADIAVRVTRELSLDQPPPFICDDSGPQTHHQEEETSDDEEFEFAFVCGNPASSPVPADEIFHNGQIKAMYQVITGDSFFVDDRPRTDDGKGGGKKSHRPRLKALMRADREETEAEAESSCSSSEADELDRLASGTNCVWNPRAAVSPPEKSKSTGSSSTSSRRWKLKQLLLKRSNSDGSGTTAVVVVAREKGGGKGNGSTDAGGVIGKGKTEGRQGLEYYVRNRNNRGDIRRKSFLPYRQDLVGFFTNVNGLGRNFNLHPF